MDVVKNASVPFLHVEIKMQNECIRRLKNEITMLEHSISVLSKELSESQACYIFVEHIKAHLDKDQYVICKICDRSMHDIVCESVGIPQE